MLVQKASAAAVNTLEMCCSPCGELNRELSVRRAVALCLAAFSITLPVLSVAQDPSNPEAAAPQELQEIVVTAEKRSSDVQRVSAAVTVVSGEALAEMGLTDPRSLKTLVPALDIGTGGIDPAIFLRGVGQTINAANTSSAVAVNLNGVYLPRSMILRSMFDVQQLEVLPGPQGTLYGSNSIGGTINISTKRPAESFEANTQLEGGNYGTAHVSAGVSAPLNDVLGIRTAVDYSRHDGYYSNGAGKAESVSARVTGQYKPNSDFSATLFATYIREFDPSFFYTNSPYYKDSDPWYFPRPRDEFPGSGGQEVAVTGEVEYRFSGLLLSYVPGYADSHIQASGALSSVISSSLAPEEGHQYSQELRLANEDGGKSKWLIGLYWYRSRYFQDLLVNIGPVNISQPVSSNEQITAVFGQESYSVQPWLRLVAGLRVSRNEKSGAASTTVIGGPTDSLTGFDHTWSNLDWKVGTEFDVSSKSMAYVHVDTGFLNGAFGIPPIPAGYTNQLEPEKLLGVTAGSKNRFLNDRLEVNAELFHYNYNDYQVSTANSADLTYYANADKAIIYGAQVDVAWLLGAADEFKANIGLLHPIARNFSLGVGGDYSGYQLPGAAYETVHLGWRHTWRLAQGSVAGMVDSSYNSGEWVTFNHSPGTHNGAYTKTDLALTYASGSHGWSVGGYVHNLENSATFSYAITGTIPGPASVFLDAPRTYGLRLTWNL